MGSRYGPATCLSIGSAYLPLQAGFLYLSLLTDAYSRKIIGYCLGDNLQSMHTVTALKMALADLAPQPVEQELIHGPATISASGPTQTGEFSIVVMNM